MPKILTMLLSACFTLVIIQNVVSLMTHPTPINISTQTTIGQNVDTIVLIEQTTVSSTFPTHWPLKWSTSDYEFYEPSSVNTVDDSTIDPEREPEEQCEFVTFLIIGAVIMILIFNGMCWFCFSLWFRNEVKVHNNINTNSMQHLNDRDMQSNNNREAILIAEPYRYAKTIYSSSPTFSASPSPKNHLVYGITEHKSSDTNSQNSDIALTPILTFSTSEQSPRTIKSYESDRQEPQVSNSLTQSQSKSKTAPLVSHFD